MEVWFRWFSFLNGWLVGSMWMFPKIAVLPNHPLKIGFSIIFTIHFGVFPLFLETPMLIFQGVTFTNFLISNAALRIAKLTDMSLEELRLEFQALKIPSEVWKEGGGWRGWRKVWLMKLNVLYVFIYIYIFMLCIYIYIFIRIIILCIYLGQKLLICVMFDD